MPKELGKLTAAQFQELIQYIPKLLVTLREMNEELASAPAARFDAVMSGDYGGYSTVYELPFIGHLTLLIAALNRQDEVLEMSSAADPQQAVLDALKGEGDDKAHNEKFELHNVVALVYAFGRTFQSMVTYGRSISSLLQAVRENNDQEALFKAKRLPMAYVKVSAEYLAHKGPEAVGKELQELLPEFRDLTGSNMVSRIDLAADFTSPVVMDSWHRSAWVTRATEIHSYAKDQEFTLLIAAPAQRVKRHLSAFQSRGSGS